MHLTAHSRYLREGVMLSKLMEKAQSWFLGYVSAGWLQARAARLRHRKRSEPGGVLDVCYSHVEKR